MHFAEILDFWFGPSGWPRGGQAQAFWFTKSDSTDGLMRERFGTAVEAALRGELDPWAASSDSALALILLLDQFTRNIHRDTAAAFAGDAAALGHARRVVDTGADRDFGVLQRWFIYLPFEHSERIEDQHESLRLFTTLAGDGEPGALEWAQRHFEVIRRFGRYPHRNAILGRDSSPEEIEFLAQPGSRF